MEEHDAGVAMGRAIVETIQLISLKRVRLAFLRGVTLKLYEEAERIAKELED